MQPTPEARARKIEQLKSENEQIAEEALGLQEKVAELNQQILELKQDSEVNDYLLAELRLEGDRIAE